MKVIGCASLGIVAAFLLLLAWAAIENGMTEIARFVSAIPWIVPVILMIIVIWLASSVRKL